MLLTVLADESLAPAIKFLALSPMLKDFASPARVSNNVRNRYPSAKFFAVLMLDKHLEESIWIERCKCTVIHRKMLLWFLSIASGKWSKQLLNLNASELPLALIQVLRRIQKNLHG